MQQLLFLTLTQFLTYLSTTRKQRQHVYVHSSNLTNIAKQPYPSIPKRVTARSTSSGLTLTIKLIIYTVTFITNVNTTQQVFLFYQGFPKRPPTNSIKQY